MLGGNSSTASKFGALRSAAIFFLLLAGSSSVIEGFSLVDTTTSTPSTAAAAAAAATTARGRIRGGNVLSTLLPIPLQLSSSPRGGFVRQSSPSTPLFAEPSSDDKEEEEEEEEEVTPPKTEATSTAPPSSSLGGLDVSAIFKYGAAIAIQMGLVAALFQGLDRFLVPLLASRSVRIPFALNAMAMYVLALKSRVFNPLSNQRPKPATKEIDDPTITKRNMPTWTPPGVVFPIVWLLLIGPLRAVTSAMIIQAAGGVYTTQALLALILHLSIGDVWNTINNVEQRYGTSVLGVVCVWISAAVAARQYYLAVPLAGKLLSLKLIWLTVASSLITRTWQLNPNKDGRWAPLLPTKGDGETKFEWFGS